MRTTLDVTIQIPLGPKVLDNWVYDKYQYGENIITNRLTI